VGEDNQRVWSPTGVRRGVRRWSRRRPYCRGIPDGGSKRPAREGRFTVMGGRRTRVIDECLDHYPHPVVGGPARRIDWSGPGGWGHAHRAETPGSQKVNNPAELQRQSTEPESEGSSPSACHNLVCQGPLVQHRVGRGHPHQSPPEARIRCVVGTIGREGSRTTAVSREVVVRATYLQVRNARAPGPTRPIPAPAPCRRRCLQTVRSAPRRRSAH
jgi:hypothetical protein